MEEDGGKLSIQNQLQGIMHMRGVGTPVAVLHGPNAMSLHITKDTDHSILRVTHP
jgi:hypothetical protein